ncbi:hypothetical protein ACJIZ3_023035 [Penstemon smallii]|uniref:Cytochrome P450 n=1 Tax=Penstemon smallii TaxID=265156 RepID=A0ABD3TN09_9LAMI
MELWFIIVVSICISCLIKSIITLNKTSKNLDLPPGPPAAPLIGNFIWLRKPISELETILRRLKTLYGPIITMTIGRRPFIFVSSHSIAHRSLIQNGAVFADRPPPPPTARIANRSMKSISSSGYGSTWRLLRRNLTHEILHPGRVKSHSGSRKWVLSLLIRRLMNTAESVKLIDHFQFAMFCLLVFMCFGDKLEENQIKEIEDVQRNMLLGFRRFNVLNFWPIWISKIIYSELCKELAQLRKYQDDVLIPLIRARLESKREHVSVPAAYVDTLVDLELPEENNRKLEESEMVSLCGEFLAAGTDTTSTALQWIMANLVKYPHFQTRLYNEIISIVGPPPAFSEEEGTQQFHVVEEEDVQKMSYLKAVVLEGLRRHPPGHFVLPHRVTQEVELEGYKIPKNALVNFMVADMGWDPEVWEDPMEFKPERFLDHESAADAFDITGSREVKMMPFGAGRRICPASGWAMLHLEYFVANLIWYFEWTPLEGDEIDLTEKQEFTVIMKNPLCVRISPRVHI